MQNTELLLKELTLEEKCALLSGAETFKTRGMPEHGIPQIWLSDGPHGLRKQAGESDHLGLNPSVPATCFPTASAVANSWDAALGEEIGAALGEEAAAQEVSVVLGPGLNMKRNPLCGRSFEYFSEDPYLAGKLAAGYIRGIQSKGVAACPKHFAVNSQETRRMASDSIVDERTLREIYLTGFEIAVKEGHPRSIMSSYNLVNGTYANENKHLLMEILRGEWGFDGAVITDWGGSNDHALGVKNGSTLEMPAPGGDSVRFPFGYGMSYTTFAYSDMVADEQGVSLTVTNTGSVAGTEIVQLYVAKKNSELFRPAKELKGFARVTLAPGEKQRITIMLDDKAFRFWNVKANRWEIEGGEYELLVGASVEDIRLCEKISVHGTATVHPYEDRDLDCYYKGDVLHVSDADFEKLLGHPIPKGKTKIDRNLTLGELDHARSPLGWLVWLVLTILLDVSYKRGKPDLNILFQYNMPLRALAKMTNGAISMGMVDGIVMELQGFWILGLVRVIYEAIKNVVLNAQMEKRLRGA